MKIIASDYDGTLNHGGIDDVKRAAISKWRACGNVFALISGRGVADVLLIQKKEKFECDYLIADNGAVILTPDGTVVSDIRCDGEITKPLLKHLFEKGCPWGSVQTAESFKVFADAVEIEEDEEGYTLDDMPEVQYFNQISTMLPDFEKASEVTESVREKFSDVLNPLQNGTCIDIVGANMNKAKGLYILLDLLNAEYGDLIAVGDNINDTDMIAEFKSYAMENAVESIKELADYITPGITELIERELS